MNGWTNYKRCIFLPLSSHCKFGKERKIIDWFSGNLWDCSFFFLLTHKHWYSNEIPESIKSVGWMRVEVNILSRGEKDCLITNCLGNTLARWLNKNFATRFMNNIWIIFVIDIKYSIVNSIFHLIYLFLKLKLYIITTVTNA